MHKLIMANTNIFFDLILLSFNENKPELVSKQILLTSNNSKTYVYQNILCKNHLIIVYAKYSLVKQTYIIFNNDKITLSLFTIIKKVLFTNKVSINIILVL